MATINYKGIGTLGAVNIDQSIHMWSTNMTLIASGVATDVTILANGIWYSRVEDLGHMSTVQGEEIH